MTEADDSWLDDDGRDGMDDETSFVSSLKWVLGAAAIMLLLPRQWVSAVMAFVLAVVVAIIDHRRKKAAPSSEAASSGEAAAEEESSDEASGDEAEEAEPHGSQSTPP